MGGSSLEKKMEAAYGQLRGELFCEETCLIYDSISSHEHEQRFGHLPSIEEINLSIPNPHGYATGMEDCMLNAGFAMAVCVLRAKTEPAKAGECADFARRLYRGMMACAEVHGHAGYVVRGISPRDGKSVYIESSRDQFTLFVYGAWRYYHSEFSTPEEKGHIQKVLRQISTFAESRMHESFDYNLGRVVGKPAVNLRMIGGNAHEAMRLPMIFAATYDVTGDEEFKRLYDKYYARGMADSLKFAERKKPWWHIELSQMQFSLALCEAVDPDPEHRQVMGRLMDSVARVAEVQSMDYDLPRLRDHSGTWRPLAHAWRDSPKFTVQLFEGKTVSLFGGKFYLKGEESQEFKDAFDKIRAVGNMVVSVLLAKNYRPSPGFLDWFAESASSPDYEGHTSGALVNILCAYYLSVGTDTRAVA
jgi:hypothetical protein